MNKLSLLLCLWFGALGLLPENVHGDPLYPKNDGKSESSNIIASSQETRNDRALMKASKSKKGAKQKKGTSAPTSMPTVSSATTSIRVALPIGTSMEDFLPSFNDYASTLVGASTRRALNADVESAILTMAFQKAIECVWVGIDNPYDFFCSVIDVIANGRKYLGNQETISLLETAIQNGTAQEDLRKIYGFDMYLGIAKYD